MTGAKMLNPAQVCKVLETTPNSIKRLIKDGDLKVKEVVEFKNGKMYLYSYDQVKLLIPKMPKIKKEWEQQDNFYYRADKLARARAKQHNSIQHKTKLKNEFLKEITFLPESRQKLLRTCYFLFHLNHYAKTGNSYLYDLKELVLNTFVKNYDNSNLLNISFIQGNNKIILCPECKAKAKNQKLSYPDFIDRKGGCSKCSEEYNYYSLYEFSVEDFDYRFCFHTPYAVANKWFKNTSFQPPVKDTPNKEGAYAFGRAIYESEAQAVELAEVIEELQNFLSEYGIPPLFETGI